MDGKTAAVLDSYQANLLREKDGEDSDFDEEEFMEMLDNDPAMDSYRERRMQELSEQMTMARRNVQEGYGTVEHVKTEKEVLDITTRTQGSGNYSVIHFSHPDFQRCKIMREKLDTLAAKHMKTRFLEITATDAPFLVMKLGIKVLPCVLGYINGKECIRLVGFDQLGNTDNFEPEVLESRLLASGVIQRSHGKLSKPPKPTPKPQGGGLRQAKRTESDDDDL